MGAYNFHKSFVPFLLDGSKAHTIRGKRKNPDKPGNTFYAYTGLRTKQCSRLFQAPVLKVEDILFERARVWVQGVELDAAEKDLLAWRDGFRLPAAQGGDRYRGSFDLMLEFWIKVRKTTEFAGDLIHWDADQRILEVSVP